MNLHKQTKEKCRQLVKKIMEVKVNREREEKIRQLPPYNQYVASLQSRIQFQARAYQGVLLVLAVFIGVQQYDKYVLNKRLNTREVYFTPTHIPNILRLRANTLSDSLVFEFSDWFITQLGSINHLMVDEKFKTLTKYMSPKLRTRFLREMRPKIDLWKMRRVDQEITFEPVKTFDRKTIDRDTTFTVSVWTNVRKYVDGREQEPEREQITLVFRTSPVDSEKTWLFEVTDILRRTPQELEDEQMIKEVEKK